MAEVYEKWYKGEKVEQLGRRGKHRAKVRRADGRVEMIANGDLYDTREPSVSNPKVAIPALESLISAQITELGSLSSSEVKVDYLNPSSKDIGTVEAFVQPEGSISARIFAEENPTQTCCTTRSGTVGQVSDLCPTEKQFNSNVADLPETVQDQAQLRESPVEFDSTLSVNGFDQRVLDTLEDAIRRKMESTKDSSTSPPPVAFDPHAENVHNRRKSHTARVNESVAKQVAALEKADEAIPHTTTNYPNHPKKA